MRGQLQHLNHFRRGAILATNGHPKIVLAVGEEDVRATHGVQIQAVTRLHQSRAALEDADH